MLKVSVGVSSPADGVALGAAASTSQTSVQLIVFVAIMLHKVIMVYILYSKSMFFYSVALWDTYFKIKLM